MDNNNGEKIVKSLLYEECMFGIVILHFNVLEYTTACVRSVLNGFESANIHIVIVDNKSPNGSGQQLKDLYADNNLVSVKCNNQNLGFANGMNAGIEFLNQKYHIQYFILLNNDTEVVGKNWPVKINEKYEKYRFAVLGPDIIDLDGTRHCNPAAIQIKTKKDLESLIKEKRKMIVKYNFYIEPCLLHIKKAIKQPIKKLIKYKSNYCDQNYRIDCVNVQLQGSCIILSEQYFKHYDKLFDKTFLYFEEAILKYLCDLNNLVSLYSPDIQLIHKEGKSTDTITKNERKRKLFYLRHSLESCENFLKWIQEENI